MTDRGLCDRCARLLKSNLIELEEIYVGLSLERGQSTEPKVSGSKEPPLPLRLDALSWLGHPMPGDHLSEHAYADDQIGALPIMDTLRSWARLIHEQRALTLGVVRNVVTDLLRHHEWASQQMWADDYAEEIADQVAAGRSLGGLWKLKYRLEDACPECGVCALTREDGSDWVACESCHANWDPQHHELLAKAATQEAS